MAQREQARCVTATGIGCSALLGSVFISSEEFYFDSESLRFLAHEATLLAAA
jgi:hypothetical protein